MIRNGNNRQEIVKYEIKDTSTQSFWHLIDTFILPLQPGQFVATQMLNPNDFEFKYVAYKFNQSFNARDPALNDIKATLDKVKALG